MPFEVEFTSILYLIQLFVAQQVYCFVFRGFETVDQNTSNMVYALLQKV